MAEHPQNINLKKKHGFLNENKRGKDFRQLSEDNASTGRKTRRKIKIDEINFSKNQLISGGSRAPFGKNS